VNSPLVRAVDRALAALTIPHRSIGVALLRIILGSVVAWFYLENFHWRGFLWGWNGQLPAAIDGKVLTHIHGPLLYLLSPSPVWFELLYWTGFIAAVALAVGILPRITAPLSAALLWSVLVRNPYVNNAGWDLAFLLLVFLTFAQSGRLLTVLPRTVKSESTPLRRISALLHNGALALILLQIVTVYTFSSFYKLDGHMWRSGTALYYVMRSNFFNITPLSPLIYHSVLLTAFATYGTLLFQIAFPFCIWQRPQKYVVAVAALAFHVGIAVSMSLPSFSLVMIGCEAVIFTDREYQRFWSWLKALLHGKDEPEAVLSQVQTLS
jgi:hypothetical protein